MIWVAILSFVRDSELNLGFHTCQASPLVTESSWVFFRYDFALYSRWGCSSLCQPGWLQILQFSCIFLKNIYRHLPMCIVSGNLFLKCFWKAKKILNLLVMWGLNLSTWHSGWGGEMNLFCYVYSNLKRLNVILPTIFVSLLRLSVLLLIKYIISMADVVSRGCYLLCFVVI